MSDDYAPHVLAAAAAMWPDFQEGLRARLAPRRTVLIQMFDADTDELIRDATEEEWRASYEAGDSDDLDDWAGATEVDGRWVYVSATLVGRHQ